MQNALPDALADALGRVVADVQRAFEEKLQLRDAQMRAFLAESEARRRDFEDTLRKTGETCIGDALRGVADLETRASTYLDALDERVTETLAKVKDGEKGEPGEPGPPGVDGLRGEQGERGDAGERGDDGAPGAPGEKGDRGEAGPAGPQGEKGDPGERGEAGAPGEKGDPGEQGPQGERGEKGDPGERGSDGALGEKGDRGDPGERGERGPPGDIPLAPPEIAERITRALAFLETRMEPVGEPAPIIHINTGERPRTKTITMQRDRNGNAVAHVVEEA